MVAAISRARDSDPGAHCGASVLIVRRRDGTVVVAGQTHDTASGYSADALGWRARRDGHTGKDGPVPPAPVWMDRLEQFDPARVCFAHDHAVWEP